MSLITIAILILFAKPIITQADKAWRSAKKSELGNDVMSFLGEDKQTTSQDQNQDQQS